MWCFDIHIHCEMIIIIKLIDTSITLHSYLFFFFWCMVRTLKIYSLLFETTSVNLDHIMLSEISQIQKDKYCMILLICEN